MKPKDHYDKRVQWIIKLHRHLFKPPHPVSIFCPACSKKLMKVNAATIEIENNFGIGQRDLVAKDAWTQYKHSCGAKITVYWAE